MDGRVGVDDAGLVGERSLLEVNAVTTYFDTRGGAVKAVNEVSFRADRREMVGVVGESGCGKSATVRTILGLVRAPGRVVGGEVLLDGQDLLQMSKRELRRVRGDKIGFVAQNPFASLNPILRIHRQFHNVITAQHGRMSRASTREMACEMLGAVGIPGPDRILDGYAHELSGGMAQRVVIALALILDPELIVADEPTTALDVTIQRQILDLLRRKSVDEGRSLVLVTHDLGVVAQYCDRVVVMYAGKVVETGPVKEVFGRPAHPYTLGLLRSVPRRGVKVQALGGRVPSLIDYPPGCAFADRCSFVTDRCREDVPELLSVFADGDVERTARCHIDEQEVSAGVTRAS
jgi:peptide/nickel transport system ATP-binding protein